MDLEMTGLDPAKDRVVEICIERVQGGDVRDRIHTLVRPETLILPPSAPVAPIAAVDVGSTDAESQPTPEVGNANIHGIFASALAGAPVFASLVDHVTALLDGAVLVAHGASWDVAFLEAELARAGSATRIPFYIDTLNLSRRTFGLPRHSLDALREHFGLDRSRAHRADADVAALRAVWERCLQALEPSTARDVWEVRIAEKRAREQILAECKSAIEAKVPVEVVYRPRARKPEPMRMVLVELLTGLDPPRVIGYQLPGRGRRELRADRILRIDRVES
ncbi:DNA polymerase III epsilon subunit [Labilithrix luteola]|uniref:DNA polymerase III epsilon subunit n=1 Tax=Labilithrix luteola TaxID=1391654 RepID=A0A0K1PT70_9BACT|nr:3'-5' exonuclease [Labilithrix luteola]AKU96586.1 DNA polymerase III epsilon subunit [Labilithrix luteola]